MERELKDPKFDYSVYNLGISGDNSDDLLERFEFEIKQRLHKEDEIIFVFAIGINDSQFIYSKNNFSVLADKFQQNIKQFINFSGKISNKTIFIGLTPVDKSKTSPIPWDTDKSYENKYISNYNNIIKSICREKQVYFINMFDEFNKTDYKELLEDGLHPNSKGHQKMFEIVRDFLVGEGIIK
ncbi:hypothetical protein KAI56_00865 [Candidatus Parcubacteria bacterium]|nr:hypothetical protein [Candidatus Parcubacteria bacterium]